MATRVSPKYRRNSPAVLSSTTDSSTVERTAVMASSTIFASTCAP
jgi:hypothetical protein